MSNNKKNEISLFYAEKFYKNLDQEEINIIENEGLDFIINIIRKVESLGPNIMLFEGPETVFLEKVDGLHTIIKDLSSTIEHVITDQKLQIKNHFLVFPMQLLLLLTTHLIQKLNLQHLLKKWEMVKKQKLKFLVMELSP